MCLRFKNEKVSIAVVGIRASGKSYLLSDIITSLGNLGYQRFDTQSGSYASIGNYKAKTRTDGKLSQTEMYACRPGENIYGATYKGHDKKIDVDFVDIPGEVFNGAKEVNNNTYLTVFTSYRYALLKLSKKLFTVIIILLPNSSLSSFILQIPITLGIQFIKLIDFITLSVTSISSTL